LNLIKLCQKEVFDKFGAKIELEVQLIGDFKLGIKD